LTRLGERPTTPASGGGRPHRAGAVFAARLSFEAVERRFGEKAALAGVTFDVEPGEIVCLLGPSGCGKTTLLRVAAGIDRPTAGRVLLNGNPMAGPGVFVPPERRNVGLMFQDFALFPHLTILDNVAFGLTALPRHEAHRAALAVLARVGLDHYANEYPHVLSGGQQQRVALARAIVPRPAVMLMDEPFSGLDVMLRDAMQEETLALLREIRATTMIVTHSPAEALRLGDRIGVMRAGRLVQIGRAEELYRQPADLFIARLFSEMNELPFPVSGGAIRTPIGTFASPDLVEGESGILGIRYRTIRMAAPGEGLAGRILRVRFQGDLALLDIAVAGFDQPLRTLVREWEEPKGGDDVQIVVDPASVLVFPAAVSEEPAGA
jgi:iron(III) transport system ATP-binding protein